MDKLSDDFEVCRLFKKLDKLRIETKTSIEEMSYLIGISSLSYKNWRRGIHPPNPWKEPRLRHLVDYFTNNFDKQKAKREAMKREQIQRTIRTTRTRKAHKPDTDSS